MIKEAETAIPLCYAIAAKDVSDISPADVANRTTALQKWYEDNANWTVTARCLAALAQTPETPS